MKAARFEYHAPESLPEALELMQEYADDAKFLAGGQSLVPILALRLTRFGHIIDLNRVPELRRLESVGGVLTIGAMTRQGVAEHSTDVADIAPLLTRSIPHIGHFQIRNRGTIGGSISHADPASELPSVAKTLGATMIVQSRGGEREIDANDFFTSIWQTAIEPDEMLVAVRFPQWGPRSGYAIEELAWRSGDFAIAGVTCAVRLDESGRIDRAGMNLMGMGSTPWRCVKAETALVGQAVPEIEMSAISELALVEVEPNDDVHASAKYRTQVARTLVRRALTRALEEASHG